MDKRLSAEWMTRDDLAALNAALGQGMARFVGGAVRDSLLGLPTWHEWEHLLDLAHIVVAERPGNALDGQLPAALAARLRDAWADDAARLREHPAGRVWRLRQPLQAESATAVRRLIASGGRWRELVPDAVAGYIGAHGLYGCATA